MYVLPNVRPVGTHHSSNARGWPGGMLMAGIDLHITPGCLFSGGGGAYTWKQFSVSKVGF